MIYCKKSDFEGMGKPVTVCDRILLDGITLQLNVEAQLICPLYHARQESSAEDLRKTWFVGPRALN